MKQPVSLWDKLEFEGTQWQVVAEVTDALVLRALSGGRLRRIGRHELLASPDYVPSLPRADLDRVDLVSMLSEADQERVAFLHHHIVEVLTGLPPHPSPDAQPRPEYSSNRKLKPRVERKASELKAAGTPVSARQLWRYLMRYRTEGVNGLIDGRNRRRKALTGRVDPQLVGVLEDVVGAQTLVSTGSRTRVLNQTALLAAEDGLPMPSRATGYRVLKNLERQRHTFGNATTRRTQANRPDRDFGRQAPARPGELTEIDSTPLDLMVLYPDGVAGRVDLTVLLDIATRTICAALLRPVATKSVDAAVLLARAMTPLPLQPGWMESVSFSRSLLPAGTICSESEFSDGFKTRPVIMIESVTVDRGKVFVSDTFLAACERLQISITKAAPLSPTDKPHIERTFASINAGFTQYLAGYTGSNVVRRGRDPAAQAIWPLAQVQDLLDQWISLVWQNRPHSGLRHPAIPRKLLTPNEMYAALSTVAPAVSMVFETADYIALLPREWRTIQRYGINFQGLTYDSPRLNAYRCLDSGIRLPGARGRWEIRYDPYRLNCIFVRDHHTNSWIEAPWTMAAQTLAPFSLEVLRAATHAIAHRSPALPPTALLNEITRIQTDLLNASKQEGKAARRNAVATPVIPVEGLVTKDAEQTQGGQPQLTVVPGRRSRKMTRHLYRPQD